MDSWGFQPSVRLETASSAIFSLWVWKKPFFISESPGILSTPGWLSVYIYIHIEGLGSGEQGLCWDNDFYHRYELGCLFWLGDGTYVLLWTYCAVSMMVSRNARSQAPIRVSLWYEVKPKLSILASEPNFHNGTVTRSSRHTLFLLPQGQKYPDREASDHKNYT